MAALMDENAPRAALLFGVTGSGKTQVYLQLIAHALEQGKSAIVLVPEIGLTPQLLRQFAARFGEEVAVLHLSLIHIYLPDKRRKGQTWIPIKCSV